MRSCSTSQPVFLLLIIFEFLGHFRQIWGGLEVRIPSKRIGRHVDLQIIATAGNTWVLTATGLMLSHFTWKCSAHLVPELQGMFSACRKCPDTCGSNRCKCFQGMQSLGSENLGFSTQVLIRIDNNNNWQVRSSSSQGSFTADSSPEGDR